MLVYTLTKEQNIFLQKLVDDGNDIRDLTQNIIDEFKVDGCEARNLLTVFINTSEL